MFALIVALVVGQATAPYAGVAPYPTSGHTSSYAPYAGVAPYSTSGYGYAPYAHRHYGHYHGGSPYLYGGWATPGYYLPYGSSVVWPPRYWGYRW
jgi:hypothetical protein